MKNRKFALASILTSIACIALLSGCFAKLGTDTVGVSGQVLTGGKLIDGSVTVSSNTATLSGLFGQGTNTYAGTVGVTNH